MAVSSTSEPLVNMKKRDTVLAVGCRNRRRKRRGGCGRGCGGGGSAAIGDHQIGRRHIKRVHISAVRSTLSVVRLQSLFPTVLTFLHIVHTQ